MKKILFHEDWWSSMRGVQFLHEQKIPFVAQIFVDRERKLSKECKTYFRAAIELSDEDITFIKLSFPEIILIEV